MRSKFQSMSESTEIGAMPTMSGAGTALNLLPEEKIALDRKALELCLGARIFLRSMLLVLLESMEVMN